MPRAQRTENQVKISTFFFFLNPALPGGCMRNEALFWFFFFKTLSGLFQSAR